MRKIKDFIRVKKIHPCKRVEDVVFIVDSHDLSQQPRRYKGFLIYPEYHHMTVTGMYYIDDNVLFVKPYPNTTRIELTTTKIDRETIFLKKEKTNERTSKKSRSSKAG